MVNYLNGKIYVIRPLVEHDDGEVVWGRFMSLQELDGMIREGKPFVPGGLKAWQETQARAIPNKYLK